MLDNLYETMKKKEYDFLRNDSRLQDNIILLVIGGSHAYGTDDADSDIDLRGISLNQKEEILLGKDFEKVVDTETDTTIFSFKHMISLLTKGTPNALEMLGCRPENYIHLTPIGNTLIRNRKLFLSKECADSFGSYASTQLRRFINKTVPNLSQSEKEEQILRSIQNASPHLKENHFPYDDSQVRLYIDKAVHEDYETEIFMDINLKHYPLSDYTGLWNEMNNIKKSYKRMGKRNSYAESHDRLNKHLCHLIRVYLTGIEILETGDIVTYREKDHDLLMKIKHGEFLDENKRATPEFLELVSECEEKMEYAKEHSPLPEKPDYKRINEFVMSVNEQIVRGE